MYIVFSTYKDTKKKEKAPATLPINNVNVIKNDTRIWSAAQMRASFPRKNPNACITFKPKMHKKEVVSSAQLLCLQNEKLPLSAEHALEMVSFC